MQIRHLSSIMTNKLSILQRIARNDASATKQCIDTYSKLIWSIVRNAGLHNGEAEDVVQNIFIELWKSADRYDPEVRPEIVFVTMIARRRMIDYLRKKIKEKERLEFCEELPAMPTYQEDSVANAFDAGKLTDSINVLSQDEQQVLKLSTLLGFSQSEIASKTGMPLGTVKSHMRRGIQKLQQLLKEQDQLGNRFVEKGVV